ncbi:hypothetical protein F0L68_21570 [Solihabitans fulvus]|uniref:Uncharacterized protein n=1 Tax=Solihabitans fulvus TaxID=1892852 RepID=A0A5B2X8Z9_9PSEU|nr:hypothetical protein F0L68_21570 [Solihabitans fulvus]
MPTPPLPGGDATKCLTAVVDLLSGTLSTLSAAITGAVAVPPDPTKLLAAVKVVVDALKAINDNNCLPIKLPIPPIPGLPLPA